MNAIKATQFEPCTISSSSFKVDQVFFKKNCATQNWIDETAVGDPSFESSQQVALARFQLTVLYIPTTPLIC